VQVDLNGDAVADLEVELTGALTLRQDATIQNFIL
jgi:hypothetical protein